MQDPIKILGVPIHAMTMQEAVKTLEERMLAKEQTFVVTANAEIIMMCQENAEYKKIICEDAELVLPDGAGAVWAGRHLGYKVPERVAGFDLYNELLDLSAHKGYKAYFFGGSPGVAEAAKAKAEELYPGVQVEAATTVILRMRMCRRLLRTSTPAVQTCFSLPWVHPSRKNGWWHTARS